MMHFLEYLIPALRRSPEIAKAKKDLERVKKENVQARDELLENISAVVHDFDIIRKDTRDAAKKRSKQPGN